MRKTILFLCASILFMFTFTGCMSAKFVVNDKWNRYAPPTYVDYFDGWWWGYGTRFMWWQTSHPAEVSLQKVCMDQKPLAVQRVKSGEDIFLGVITAGIYSPTTVKVWCGE